MNKSATSKKCLEQNQQHKTISKQRKQPSKRTKTLNKKKHEHHQKEQQPTSTNGKQQRGGEPEIELTRQVKRHHLSTFGCRKEDTNHHFFDWKPSGGPGGWVGG